MDDKWLNLLDRHCRGARTSGAQEHNARRNSVATYAATMLHYSMKTKALLRRYPDETFASADFCWKMKTFWSEWSVGGLSSGDGIAPYGWVA